MALPGPALKRPVSPSARRAFISASPRRLEHGFSLVELMVSTVIFAMVSAGSLGMFSISTRQAAVSRLMQEQEFAIRMDMATIQNINDRFTCMSGVCQIDSVGAAPGQTEYYPSSSTAQANFAYLCSQGLLLVVPTASIPTYGKGLLTLIGETATTTELQSLSINRSVSADATEIGRAHV